MVCVISGEERKERRDEEMKIVSFEKEISQVDWDNGI